MILEDKGLKKYYKKLNVNVCYYTDDYYCDYDDVGDSSDVDLR